jgi:ABC-type polysaccharide/polyol phosphate transport system ATPase subunit
MSVRPAATADTPNRGAPLAVIAEAVGEYSERFRDIGGALAKLRQSLGAQVVFHTYGGSGPHPDLQSMKGLADFRSNGEVKFLPDRLKMVTRGKAQISRVDLGALTESVGWAVHVTLSVHNSVANNFYMRLGQAEVVRFGRAGFNLVGHGVQSLLDVTVPHLYSLCTDEQWLWVYVDGTLLWRKRRNVTEPLGSLVFELISEVNVDMEVSVLGLELWTVPTPFLGLRKNEFMAVERLMQQRLEAGEVTELCRMLRNFDGLPLERHGELLYERLRELLYSTKGVREWEIEELSSYLPPALRERWDREFTENLPQPRIEATNVRVRFERNPLERWTIKRLIKGNEATILPVNGVSLKAFQSDIIGIIGSNGAGKSTLLKALAGLLPIETGRIRVNGSIRLLKAGLGMRPDLSGRDNIMLAGIYMGLSRRQIADVIDEVIEFTELGEAIDRPIRYYSDGMLSRLMFAVATAVPPQVLMLDELLSAGDLTFRRKAEARMQAFISKAATVIVVTHDLNFVRTQCNKAIHISNGRLIYCGDPIVAISSYLDEIHIRPDEARRFEGPIL